MERRDFLKLAGVAGLGVAGGATFIGESKADEPFKGPYWFIVFAGGGWDPTSFCDPKGAASAAEQNPMNHYLASDIATIGNFRVAPLGTNIIPFFTTMQNDLLVINGVDFATNSHDAGTRCAGCGMLAENKPSFGALVAGAYAPTAPMSFLTNGGYDTSGGAVAVTRVASTNALRRIAFPNRVQPDDEYDNYHPQGVLDAISKAREERLKAQQARQQLPRIHERMGMLYMARSGQNQLRQLTQFLPEQGQGGLRGQADIALAAMRAGVCVSANLSIGGFDTHGNHDNEQVEALDELFEGVMYLWNQAQSFPETQGNIRVAVVSDFGRTPRYNEGNGKDHWSISSILLMGKDIPGGKVVGATTEEHDPLTVNPNTLQVDPAGVRITPGHVHKWMRKISGIEDNPVVQKAPLSESDFLDFSKG